MALGPHAMALPLADVHRAIGIVLLASGYWHRANAIGIVAADEGQPATEH